MSYRFVVEHRPWRHFIRGPTVQITNAKAALTWIAIMSLGVQEGAPYWVIVAMVLGTTTLSIARYLLRAGLFDTTNGFGMSAATAVASSSLWDHFSAWLVSSC